MTGKARKTVKVSDVRAFANRVLAGSQDDLIGFREGICSMYEHIAMDANDYHGFNDLIQRWGVDGDYIDHSPEPYRRHYFGTMTGDDAQVAEDAIKAYRERYKREHAGATWDYMPNEATRAKLARINLS